MPQAATLDEMLAQLTPLARATPALVDVPREDARDAHWVEPTLVGEVTYGELTDPLSPREGRGGSSPLVEGRRLRHPVWKGLRPDKSPDEVVWEVR